MVTLPLARIVTGVFVAFRVTFTVAKGGMLTLVKLNTPLGGRASVVVPFGGVNAPSAPVLPLLNVWASAGETASTAATSPTIAVKICMRTLLVGALTAR